MVCKEFSRFYTTHVSVWVGGGGFMSQPPFYVVWSSNDRNMKEHKRISAEAISSLDELARLTKNFSGKDGPGRGGRKEKGTPSFVLLVGSLPSSVLPPSS